MFCHACLVLSDLLKEQPALSLPPPCHRANSGVRSVLLPGFQRAQDPLSNGFVLGRGSRGLAWPLCRELPSRMRFLWGLASHHHLRVWSASVVPNRVQCMNLDNAGFVEKTTLQFLILGLLLELTSERLSDSENND